MSQSGTEAAPLDLLLVCTANECRSAMAEQLFGREVGWRRLNWTVRSAGSRTTGGRPMNKRARKALRKRGIDVAADWASTALTDELIAGAGLILVADQGNWSAVVGRSPDAADRTFLLLQFARLIGAADEAPGASSGSAAELISAARRMQARIQPVPLAELELTDPVGESYRRFRACADQIDAAAQQILNSRPR